MSESTTGIIKGKKKGIGIQKSRKSLWRRIDHNEIEDIAALDVKDTIVKRIFEEGRKKNELRKRNRNENPFFTLDLGGTKSGLSQSIRKDIAKREKGSFELSDHHVRSIKKRRQTLEQREKSLQQEEKARSLITNVFDVWGVEEMSSRLTPIKRTTEFKNQKFVKGSEVIRIPAVKSPLAGQSVNPDPREHEDLVMSAVAVEVEKERRKSEFDRSVHPVTYALFDILPQTLVESLTSIQKQQTFAFYNSIKSQVNGESNIQKLTEFLKVEFGIDIEKFENEDKDSVSANKVLGLHVKNNVFVAESESEEEEEKEENPQKGENETFHRVNNRRKTKADRNRFGRHLIRLKEAASEREHKKFVNSVERIKEYLKEIEDREEQLVARAEYRQAMADAIKEAALKGVLIRLKRGKHVFEELPTELILPSAVEASAGSLRKTKFSQVAGSTIRDRSQSVYRRGLLEIPPSMTPDQLYRVRRRAQWKKKSRKLVIKF